MAAAETTTTRKPRAVRTGVVASSQGDKTITVVMERRVKHDQISFDGSVVDPLTRYNSE